MRCCVPDCSNDTKNATKRDGITFHEFPKEASIRKSWINSLGIPDYEPGECSAVCSQHFQLDAFYEIENGLRQLKNGAFPVLAAGKSTEKLDLPAALRVCRVCLAMDVRMTRMAENRLNLLFVEVTGVSLDLSRQLPKMLCWECTARLISSHRFRQKALKTQTLLMNMKRGNSDMTIRDIKSINRTNNRLKTTLIQKYYDANNCDFHIRDYDVTEREIETEEIQMEIKPEIKSEANEESDSDNDITIDNDTDMLDVGIPEMVTEVNEEQNEIFKEKHPVLKSETNPNLREVIIVKKEEKGTLSTTMDRKNNPDSERQKTDDGLSESLFTIISMTYEEQIAEIQKRQETDAFKNATFKCTACYRGFHNKDKYNAHIVKHSEQYGAFECLVCKLRLNTKRALRNHLTMVHTKKFSCKRCSFVSRDRGVALKHKKWHAGTRYQCPHCPSEFDQQSTYMSHIRTMHGAKFVCELCGNSFNSTKGVDLHKKKMHRLVDKTKTLEGPFCDDCNIRFASQEAHDTHLKTSLVHCKDDDPNKNSDSEKQKPNDGLSESVFTITSLTYEEQIAEIQKRQETDAFKNAPFKCTACYRSFDDKERYEAHILRHSEQYGAFECLVCKSRLNTKRALSNHLAAVHTKKFSCNLCPFVTKNRGVALQHKKWHAGTKYTCPHCPSEFDQQSTYMSHIRIMHGAKFVCELCGNSFNSTKGVDLHKKKKHRLVDKTKTLEGPLCGDCDIRFASQEAYDTHLKTSLVHCKDDDPYFARNDSTVKSSVNSGKKIQGSKYRTHGKNANGRINNDKSNSKEIACEVCGEVAVGFRMYHKHFRLAHPDRNRTQYRKPTNCMCEQCGMLFIRQGELVEHMNIHTGTNQFKCGECDRAFPTSAKLYSHRRKHWGAKQCPFCKRLFTYNNCKRHILTVHKGEKLYKCDICNRSLTTKTSLQQHVAHVHNGQPWPKVMRRRVKPEVTLEGPFCDNCDTHFTSQEAYDTHLGTSLAHCKDNDPKRIIIGCTILNKRKKIRKQWIRRRELVADGKSENTHEQTPCEVREGELKQMNIHTGTKQFKCRECDEAFPTKASLYSHRVKHNTEQCPICGRWIPYYNCKRHILMVHKGEKPYKCDICDKSVTTRACLRQHVAHVHNGEPWPKRARRVKREV